jgi:hypothetical protein
MKQSDLSSRGQAMFSLLQFLYLIRSGDAPVKRANLSNVVGMYGLSNEDILTLIKEGWLIRVQENADVVVGEQEIQYKITAKEPSFSAAESLAVIGAIDEVKQIYNPKNENKLKRGRWGDKEIRYVRNKMSIISKEDLATALNRSVDSVERKIAELLEYEKAARIKNPTTEARVVRVESSDATFTKKRRVTRKAWSNDDVAYLEKTMSLPSKVVAEKLGRTISAIENARYRYEMGLLKTEERRQKFNKRKKRPWWKRLFNIRIVMV